MPTRRSHRFYIPSLQKHWWLKRNVHHRGDNNFLIATVYRCVSEKKTQYSSCIRTRDKAARHSPLLYTLLTFFTFVHEFDIIQTRHLYIDKLPMWRHCLNYNLAHKLSWFDSKWRHGWIDPNKPQKNNKKAKCVHNSWDVLYDCPCGCYQLHASSTPITWEQKSKKNYLRNKNKLEHFNWSNVNGGFKDTWHNRKVLSAITNSQDQQLFRTLFPKMDRRRGWGHH